MVPLLLLSSTISLALELKTAAVCLIKDGVDPQIVLPQLYTFLDQEAINHPAPGSQAANRMWQEAFQRATPVKCAQILRPIFDL